MPKFDRNKFIEFLITNRVVGFFDKEVTLKSGRKSHWYVNWRTVAGDVCLIDRLSDFLIDFVSDLKLTPDVFYGVPEGATKLGIITTYKWAKAQGNYAAGSHALAMGRGKPKEHGAPQDRFFIGLPRGKIVVLEDVTTTGGSLLAALDQLAEVNANVIAAIGLTNRMEKTDDGRGVAEVVASRGIPYHSLSDATEFLPLACRAFSPDPKIVRAIEGEFRQYGVKPMVFETVL